MHNIDTYVQVSWYDIPGMHMYILLESMSTSRGLITVWSLLSTFNIARSRLYAAFMLYRLFIAIIPSSLVLHASSILHPSCSSFVLRT